MVLTNDERASVAQQLFGSLIGVVHRISQGGADALARHGLTPAQYQLLLAVDRNPGALQQTLAEQLEVTKGNISQLVTRLEAAGLVIRARDGAANQLVLSKRGRELLRTLVPEHDSYLAAQFAALDDEELHTLRSIVRKLSE